MHKLEPINSKALLKNFERVLKTKDIWNLNGTTYKEIMLLSGLIAHTDLGGFKRAYWDLRSLVRDISCSPDVIQHDRYVKDSFFPNEYGMEYCASKAALCKGLGEITKKYEKEIKEHFAEKDKIYELNMAKKLAEKHGYKLEVL